MNIIFYSPVDGFGKWDYSTPDKTGVGGSETSHIQVATSLNRRGYNVYNYSPIPDDFIQGNMHWDDCSRADFSLEGIWIIYRAPHAVDLINKNSKIWVVCQDVDYPDEWISVERIDKVFALCDEHAKYLVNSHPELKGKI